MITFSKQIMNWNSLQIIYLIFIIFNTCAGQKRKNKCECGKAKKPKLVENKMKITYELYKEKTKQLIRNEDNKVVNGFFDKHRPWSAQLYHEPTKTLICGGAIINTRYVV